MRKELEVSEVPEVMRRVLLYDQEVVLFVECLEGAGSDGDDALCTILYA